MFIIFKHNGEVKVKECNSETAAIKLAKGLYQNDPHAIEWVAVIHVISTLNNRYIRCPFSCNIGTFAATVEFEKLFG